MKILMLTPYLPYPPSSGGQIRSYNLIKQLSKKHKITLFSLIKSDEEKKYVDNLKKYCQDVHVFKRPEKPWTLRNIVRTGLSLHPFLVVRNYSYHEKAAVEKILAEEEFDLIHAETFYVSPHIPVTKIPVVLVEQTIEYQVYSHFVQNFWILPLRPILLIDVLKIKYWETYYWKKASRVVAVSERDAKVMRYLSKGLDVTVVPNGVGEDLIEENGIHFNKKILFMGNYAWLQNVEAARVLARKIFPKILEKVPDAQLLIAGQNTEKISKLESKNIELLDLKIDDIDGVKRAYKESGILVAPLYGPGGTRLKILGAMAAGLPVVTTEVGIEGIDAKENESVLIGKDYAGLAKQAIKLLEDKDFYEKVSKNARILVEENYSYESIAKKLDQVYQEVSNG
ncbi:MAG: Glycosyl transferase group 1 [uncultured bacterium]|uniref:Glycosyl transferase group 1 n=3 Tax=Candidatus Daviesiibacteriota TaxID=1752718 RepID=A0A0G0HY77_9BACT|nr:MAG: Glycosyl transferase group 1 [uncultured bacterium]KKQ08826.1 MAG: Glycosyl transferase group 1 [Candidatus Daviesbacteria bacterium GW2011_GWB1_36_5]KKQ81059.1 MAG: Glycosyl transferase group 1 [Candidatus Daviesbacteria bacterium GW2011_GWA1_38_7]OGE17477.1 MAG: hypothetical protein A2858_01040 [Candidatus Daviesbacteria bacterium RIFCSPHIGHO2_01_FULL_36_37]